MSLALIQEAAKDVRRLAIAGSPLAVGDFRLKKIVPPLQQAGAQVPVFAQVAKAITELVDGTEAESAARLLDLSTLLNAILYTQGQSSAAGDLQRLETVPMQCVTTRTTARVLKPLVEALASAGAGRFETIKSAVESGAFNDLRLVGPAIRALGDTYPELADLVADKILPGYGPGIVPFLKSNLDLKGKRQDARTLAVMHRLDPSATVALCKTALDEGSPEVKSAAIACLGKHEDCLSLVLDQAEAKNKVVRAAALEALAEHDRPEISKLFMELVKGKALDLLVKPFRQLRNRQVLNALLEEGNRAFDLLLKTDEEQMQRFLEILDCLKGRQDAETEAALLAWFGQCEKLAKFKAPKKSGILVYNSGDDIADRLAGVLYEIGSNRALEAVLAKRDVLPLSSFNQVLHSALRIWPAENVFQEFSPLLNQTKGVGKQKSEMLQHLIRATHRRSGSAAVDVEPRGAGARSIMQVRWDERWLDAAIQADQRLVVCCLARPNHKAAQQYLLKLAESPKLSDAGLVVRALVQCQYPKVTECFLGLWAKQSKNATYLDYELQSLLNNARDLPAADLPKLEAFAAKLNEKFIDEFLVAIDPLRHKTPPPE